MTRSHRHPPAAQAYNLGLYNVALGWTVANCVDKVVAAVHQIITCHSS
jgi:hypothetical protein